MKKIFLCVGLAIFVGTILVSCSKDSPFAELLPNANVVLTDDATLMDSIYMSGGVAGVKVGNMFVISGTKSKKELLVYIKGTTDGDYGVDISANALLSFDLTNIKTSTVIYYVSKEEYYLLVKGNITLDNTETSMTSGTFEGKVIPAHKLASHPSLETIKEWYDGTQNITGDFNIYSVKF